MLLVWTRHKMAYAGIRSRGTFIAKTQSTVDDSRISYEVHSRNVDDWQAGQAITACKIYHHVHCYNRQQCMSTNCFDMIQKKTSSTMVQWYFHITRSFPVAAARTWNALPQLIWNAPFLPDFRQELKTVLFQSSYPDAIWQWTVLYLHSRRSLLLCHHVLAATNHTVRWSCSSSAIMPP